MTKRQEEKELHGPWVLEVLHNVSLACRLKIVKAKHITLHQYVQCQCWVEVFHCSIRYPYVI